jgi:hypothetical protein
VCNARNHSDDCTCGFGGEGHLGGGHGGGWARTVTVQPSRHAPRSTAWARWATGHARSDLGERLTHPTVCPVCGADIFFHTNGNGDVVFFDELGPPWKDKKHPCLTTDDGIRAASRSHAIRAVATLVARPSLIPLPRGLPAAEFEPSFANRVVHGVVLRKKDKTVYWTKGASAIRHRLEAVALALYTGTKRTIRVYASSTCKVRVGEVVRILCRVRLLNGGEGLWAETLEVTTPEIE